MNRYRLPLILLALAICGCKSTDQTSTPAASSNSLPSVSRPRSETERRRQIEEIRLEKDQYLRSSEKSPLPEEERAGFKGLKYFPIDPGYRFECELKRYAANERVQMLTTAGEQDEYIRYGYFEFNVGSTPCRLDVFKPASQEPNARHLFIPFRDATSGKESYGAGRYLDLEESPDPHYALDFNLAYNPYCAYNHNYSCPIPPSQNTLKAAIRAGEKSYRD